MQTTHRLIFQDSSKISALDDQSIDLVVTSPPYPMIAMWDEQFVVMNPEIGPFLEIGDCRSAFEAMHAVLDRVWQELYRVMKEGAYACINVGDATRTINKRFRLFANHSRIQSKLYALGFDILPLILWRKQTNVPNKFMGSGMLPAGAYVTLEHEYILIFRKGNKRVFSTANEKQIRMLSSFFWEERNAWFSDFWDFKGARQETNNLELRARNAAFPITLPFRLINMYSVFGDTVFDPFAGTGTTTLAAVAAGRNSIGCEIDQSFSEPISKSLLKETMRLNRYNSERIRCHLEFVRKRSAEKEKMKYHNSYFGFPVMTRQEKELKLAFIDSAEELAKDFYRVSYFASYDRYLQQK